MAVTTELLIARHGEARCNVAGIVGGDRACSGLTERGRAQVESLASRLTDDRRTGRPIDALYCSPRLRVRETGEILAAAVGQSLRVEAGLAGPGWGDADGRPWDEVKTAFGGPPAARPDVPIARGAETWNAYLARATAWLSICLMRHAGQRVLVAAHGETVEAGCRLLLGIPPGGASAFGFIADHASLTRWQLHVNRFGRGVWMLACLNDTAHLHLEAA